MTLFKRFKLALKRAHLKLKESILAHLPAVYVAMLTNRRAVSFNWKEWIVFIALLYFSGMIGGYINNFAGLKGQDVGTQAAIFVVPATIFYFIWMRWGKKAAE